MICLIDTHALIWYITGCKKLGREAISVISDQENTIFVSKASLWEMAVKISLGKLEIGISFDELELYLEENNFLILDFDFKHLKSLLNMPFHHSDPFDRLIIAQAIVEEMPIITNDRIFTNYPVHIMGELQ